MFLKLVCTLVYFRCVSHFNMHQDPYLQITNLTTCQHDVIAFLQQDCGKLANNL